MQPQVSLSNANTSQYLLVSQSSIDCLNGHLDQPVDYRPFRPNFVVHGLQPFIEQEWVAGIVRIGRFMFSVSQLIQVDASCERCQMICYDQKTGDRSKEPLRTLARLFKKNGRIVFGVHLTLLNPSQLTGADEIACGDTFEFIQPLKATD
jgi:uncharacterized protein YcbX